MGQVNTVGSEVQGAASARSGADDITLIAQSNNPTAAGNTDLGKGTVQGLGPDGKTVYAATLVMRVYDGSGKTRFYANGKALPATITGEEAARTFVRQQIGKGTLGELPRGDQSAFTPAAKSAPATAPNVRERLKAIPHGEGDVGLRDKNGDTLATTLKAREVYRDGRWRNEGFVAERMSAYSATRKDGNAQPEANGYGYLQGEHGKMRLITGRDGRVITELPQARARASEMMRHGGLTMTTDAGAQTAQTAKEQRQQSMRGITYNDDGSLRKTTFTQWIPTKAQAARADRSTALQKIHYGGQMAMLNNVVKPVGGLFKAVGLPQLDAHAKSHADNLQKQAAWPNMNTQDNVVKGTDLAVNLVLAWGGGVVGKAGKLAKLPKMAQTTISFGVMPAVQRTGSDASDGKLNRGTVKRAGIDIAQGAAIGKLGGNGGMVRQIATGTSLQVGRKALEGETVTPGSVMKTALLTTAGSAGLHAGGTRPKIPLASSATVQQTRTLVSDRAGKLAQLVPDGLSTATKNLTSRLDSGLKAVERSAPVQRLANTPAVRAAGNGLNLLADGYRATGRLALNNPLVNSTLGRYQALSRQMRYFPEHMQAVRSLNQQKDTTKKGVRFYEDASRKLGTVNMEARSVAEQAQRQLARADEAAARGDTVTERQARHQAGIGVNRLQELSGSAGRPLQDIDSRVSAQIKKGEKLLGQQEQLYNLRAKQYRSALRADQQVQTPRVLEARQRLQEASLPFELPKQVAAKTAAYEELATQPDSSPNHVKAVEKAHAALKGTTADLSKLTLAGNDPVLDVRLDRTSGLREQLQLLRREQSDVRAAIGQLQRQQQALAQHAGGNPSAALQDALTGLGTANQFLDRRLASAQTKRTHLADEPVFAGEHARSTRLAVDAIAAESDLSAKVADAGFLHSSAKDIFDGRGKGRIDALSNKGKIEAAQQSVDATRAEVVQWRQQLTDIKASAQTILGARGTDKPAQQKALASQQWLHDDAARKLGQANKRLATAERWLDLEQRAAEPRSIQVRVRDLQAKVNTSAAVLRSAQTQYAKQQGKLQGNRDALQERLQDTTGSAQREQLQAQVQKLGARMQANEHALARVADIHSGTEALLPQAQEAHGAARATAGMTPGKLARNSLRGAMVGSTLSKGLTMAQLQLGMVAPDKAADLQPLLAQLNLPGSEKKIELESIRPVPGVPGLHSIDTVQGKVYAWRTRGAFSDVMVVAQPTPQARGMLMAALLNGGTAGNASPSIQKGSEGLYMTIDSQKFALMGATFSSVFHPDPNSTALNWWETVKVELGSVGGTLRGNTKGTHPRTGAKQPMVELVQSNSIKAPLKFNSIKLPGMVPMIGNVLQVPDGVGLSVTVKNSLGVGQLSLVYDPELGVGQLADRTVSSELKFTGQLSDKLGFTGARYPGNQPYGFFGTAVRVEKNYYAIKDPRNEGHWLMKATKGAETVFDRATGKPWLSEPLTNAIQSGLDAAKPVVNNGLKGLGQASQEAGKRLRQAPPTLRQWLDDATTPPEPSQPPTRQQRKVLPDDKARS
jgi:hypothetical protein